MSYSKYELNSKINYLNSKVTPIIPSPTPGELIVVDKIIVADQYPAPTQTTTITPTDIVLDDGVNTNTLSASDWTGNIQTVNTNANLVHYLNFSDSSATGYGHPQKTAGISCNPSTNSITATTFIGSSSSSTSAVGVDLTSDNSPTTCYIPFSQTTTPTGNSLYIDNTILPLTYVPNSSTLTASVFNGSATTVAITDDNTAAIFYPTFVSAGGSGQTLRADITGSPLQYEPSPGRMTVITLRSDFLAPTSSVSAVALYTGLSTGSISIMPTQSSGSINIGNTAVTSGLCNMRPPLVLSRQLQTTNSATYPPTVATHLGFNTQTLGSAFTTTALLSSTNTNLMSYTFTSANYGTYLFNAIVALAPTDNSVSRQLIIAISQTSATVINTPFVDLQYTIATVGAGYLKVDGVYQIYAGSPTVYLVGYCLGSAANVTTIFSTSHFSYTRIA